MGGQVATPAVPMRVYLDAVLFIFWWRLPLHSNVSHNRVMIRNCIGFHAAAQITKTSGSRETSYHLISRTENQQVSSSLFSAPLSKVYHEYTFFTLDLY